MLHYKPALYKPVLSGITMITKKIIINVEILLTISGLPGAFAAGYSDNHNDDTLSGWSTFGKRKWIETRGHAKPDCSDQGYRGFLINDHPCTDDGTFSCTICTAWCGRTGPDRYIQY